MMIDIKRLITLFVMVFTCAHVFAEAPAKHVKNLSVEDFATRQHSYDELGLWAEKNPKTAPKTFYGVWKKQEDPEAKARCYGLMKAAFWALPDKERPGFIGVGIGDMMLPGGDGVEPRLSVLINSVNPGLAGDKAGLLVGDAVIKLDDLNFNDMVAGQVPQFNRAIAGRATASFIVYIKSKRAGDEVKMVIMRNGKRIEKKLILISKPDAFLAPAEAEEATLRREQAFKKWLDSMNK